MEQHAAHPSKRAKLMAEQQQHEPWIQNSLSHTAHPQPILQNPGQHFSTGPVPHSAENYIQPSGPHNQQSAACSALPSTNITSSTHSHFHASSPTWPGACSIAGQPSHDPISYPAPLGNSTATPSFLAASPPVIRTNSQSFKPNSGLMADSLQDNHNSFDFVTDWLASSHPSSSSDVTHVPTEYSVSSSFHNNSLEQQLLDDESFSLALELQEQYDQAYSGESKDWMMPLGSVLNVLQDGDSAAVEQEKQDAQFAENLQAQYYEDSSTLNLQQSARFDGTAFCSDYSPPNLNIDLSAASLDLDCFNQRQANLTCKDCGSNLLKSLQTDSKNLVDSWINKTLQRTGQLTCSTCFAKACGGCGTNGQSNCLSGETNNRSTAWCCDDSRLFVLQLLLNSVEPIAIETVTCYESQPVSLSKRGRGRSRPKLNPSVQQTSSASASIQIAGLSSSAPVPVSQSTYPTCTWLGKPQHNNFNLPAYQSPASIQNSQLGYIRSLQGRNLIPSHQVYGYPLPSMTTSKSPMPMNSGQNVFPPSNQFPNLGHALPSLPPWPLQGMVNENQPMQNKGSFTGPLQAPRGVYSTGHSQPNVTAAPPQIDYVFSPNHSGSSPQCPPNTPNPGFYQGFQPQPVAHTPPGPLGIPGLSGPPGSAGTQSQSDPQPSNVTWISQVVAPAASEVHPAWSTIPVYPHNQLNPSKYSPASLSPTSDSATLAEPPSKKSHGIEIASHRHFPYRNKLPKGVGYGGEGDEFKGHRVGRSQPRHSQSAVPVQTKREKRDRFISQVISLLWDVLPSFERDSSFDLDPPSALLELLLRSPLLEEVADQLRNDSLADATKRRVLYLDLFQFVMHLAKHPYTLNSVIGNRPEVGSATTDSNKPLGAPPKANESTGKPSVAACMANLVKQSRLILRNAASNQKAFENDEDGDMIGLCTAINDTAEYLSLNFYSGEQQDRDMENGVNTPDKDKWLEWHREKCVLDVSDADMFATHCFAATARSVKQGAKGRMKRLVEEVANLTTSLPDGIFMRYAETRPDMMKILIIGPSGTPYENGLFEFDVWCPTNYPHEPPQFNFRTTAKGKGRFNPNLYEDGKVCLSLLNTWAGQRWKPDESTLLQVLVSLQAMVFCDQPYYNEPGFESHGSSDESDKYNRRVQSMTVRLAMVDWLHATRKTIWSEIIKAHFLRQKANIEERVASWELHEEALFTKREVIDLKIALEKLAKE